MNPGCIFKWYLNCMSFFGSIFAPASSHINPQETVATHFPLTDVGSLSLSDADKMATSLGMRYRALGVSVGLMGIVIIFLAIAPSGLSLDHHDEEIVSRIKVFLMILMLYLVFSGRRSRINQQWIRMRLVAEKMRYSALRLVTDAKPKNVSMWAQDLRARLEEVLVGKDGQIAYNASKAKQYTSIEHFADILLWTSVVLALIGAIAHFFVTWPALIFLTAFGPAAVGGIHGINGFLGIGGLIEEHSATQSRLQSAMNRLNNLKPSEDKDGSALKGIANEVLDVLGSRDERWKESAGKLGLKPA